MASDDGWVLFNLRGTAGIECRTSLHTDEYGQSRSDFEGTYRARVGGKMHAVLQKMLYHFVR